jgi:predicted nucleotide-binding protein
MSETTETNMKEGSTQDKKQSSSRVSQSDIPSMTLDEAMRIPNALRDSYALEPATPIMIGKAIGIAPTSGIFRTITGAAVAFGLTTGGYNASQIGLTDLGRRIVAPKEDGESEAAMLEAFEKPRLISEFINKYNGKRMPQKDIAKNVLNAMKVPFDATGRVFDTLYAGLEKLGYLQQINGTIMLERPKAARNSFSEIDNQEEETLEEEIETQGPVVVPTPKEPKQTAPNAIFLGHGKNNKPLEQLIKILDEYGIPHKEAQNEANAGRPIPQKVAETMRECGAAILIFTADEKFFDEAGNEIWRPSENVIHELGAASILYDNRIIIFKEESVSLASNYSSIGHISFEKDKLSAKGIDLFRELVNFRVVSIKIGV